MKVTGEIFSFQKKRKEAEEARYQKYPNFQVKGLLPDRVSKLPNRNEQGISERAKTNNEEVIMFY